MAHRVATLALALAGTLTHTLACVSTEAELVSFYYEGDGTHVNLCSVTKSIPIELSRFLTVEREVSIACEGGADCQVVLSTTVAGFGVADTGPLFMSGVTITSSPGMQLARAAVDVDRDAVATLEGVSFLGLEAFQGPALQVIGSGATAICNNCLFSNCTATAYGGAAHVTRGGSSFTCNTCNFTGNTAGVRGGSIDTDQGGDVNLKDCTFTGGEALKGKDVFVSEFTTLVAQDSNFEEIIVEESSNSFEDGGGTVSLLRSSVGVMKSAPYEN